MNLNHKDISILKELQKNSKQSLKKLSRKLNTSITTLYERIKKLEKNKVILGYKAIVNPAEVGVPAAAFVFIKMRYHYPDKKEPLSQRDLASQVANLHGVSEVHIVSGNWDIMAKIRGRDMKEIGELVIDKLRNIPGVDDTMTADVWITVKESSEVEMRG